VQVEAIVANVVTIFSESSTERLTLLSKRVLPSIVLDVLPSGALCNRTGEGEEIFKNGNCSPAAPRASEGNSWLVSALSCPNNLTE
jgi:hypothetical protein